MHLTMSFFIKAMLDKTAFNILQLTTKYFCLIVIDSYVNSFSHCAFSWGQLLIALLKAFVLLGIIEFKISRNMKVLSSLNQFLNLYLEFVLIKDINHNNWL